MSEECNGDSRSKLRLLLTRSELEKLDATVSETGTNRSLLIFEAVQRGLAGRDPEVRQEKRDRRVDAWVSRGLKEELSRVAKRLNITQQHLARTLLLSYLAEAPWIFDANPLSDPSEGDADDGK